MRPEVGTKFFYRGGGRYGDRSHAENLGTLRMEGGCELRLWWEASLIPSF
jgi:hypothetical protein